MTNAVYQLHPEHLEFPPVEHALLQPNGLLALGGDLSPERLIEAYQSGIFPWYSPGECIMWWSPNPRGVLELDQLHISRTLRKKLKKKHFSFTINHAFEEVIDACATVRAETDGTWITEAMLQAYTRMHELGHAHSVEVWQDGELVGGLYGVASHGVFCGESMFHYATDASKAAFVVLVDLVKKAGFHFIDTQMQNPHLATLGVVEMPRVEFIERLAKAKSVKIDQACWRARDYSLEESAFISN
ncbi:leucyl/phenylalanyl-tRNA--protein transferase [Catenovulum sp. SM1970]|uniref:leucyl/phenylalanyl-tRNA--protein transferase n=1 Tax=Marinifaba aquimaris TaxID=2741323 RepID=UPI001573B69C|nr:leucyl/phenylalanyl-tRNA--protein transferase [Marinifaba aquimaris]NTS77779.1 leucyl/phenylalanyl-tRNA--protein transferase [Marinifaba aquimaris]